MKNKSELRLLCLTVALVSVNLTWVSLLLIPSLGKPAPFYFPSEAAPLDGWQLTVSEPLTDLKPKDAQDLTGHSYQYTSESSTVTIQMRYFQQTSSYVTFLLKQYHALELNPQERKQSFKNHPDIGFYVGFTDPENAYLSTCINARGGTTISREQFAQNRQQHDLKLDRLLLWLIGEADLRDWRCLWVVMSTPVADYPDPELATQTLETLWSSWYKWWQPRFPPL